MTEIVLALAAVVLLLVAIAGGIAFHGVNQWTRPKRVPPSAHPSDLGLPWESVEFQSRDGVTLRGWLIHPLALAPFPGREAGAKAVIFGHGHGGVKDPDLVYAPWFCERGIPVLLFDFRNHGLSEGSLTSIGFYERYDLLGAVDYLAGRGYTRIGLLGFSMGAAVAIATAPLSENIVCVVADSPFAELRPTMTMGIRERGFPPWIAGLLSRLIFQMGARRLRCDPRQAYPLQAVQQFGNRPLLIILGECDEYIERWQGEALFEKATGPKELWIVPGAHHRETEARQPEVYRKKVMGFFEKWL